MRDGTQHAGADGGGELYAGVPLESFQCLRRAQAECADVDLHEVRLDALEVDREPGGEPPAASARARA